MWQVEAHHLGSLVHCALAPGVVLLLHCVVVALGCQVGPVGVRHESHLLLVSAELLLGLTIFAVLKCFL